jgi:uncharacterized membrane protein YeaQ/YmgE (transglycosylase-associated protein family)
MFGSQQVSGCSPGASVASSVLVLVIGLRTLENAMQRIFPGRRAMDGVGWIAAIIIGGIAGWLAEQFMKSDMGLLMNIVLGVVGAAIASAILSMFGIALGGWLGYLIAGFIGACLLIWVVRMVRGTRPA